MRRHAAWTLAVSTTGLLLGELLLAPAASAAQPIGAPIVPVAFLGLPSLHSIIEAIANGFFGALASALVPNFLKHGTVATIQHLVALPDPASWSHVSQLQGDMTYLGVTLLPVTLAVATVRYWMMGFTGAAHPVGAIGRCVAATGVLVAYHWIVEQVVTGTNTLTHAILGFPTVANGLQRIIGVLFGGALLTGAGGVFGAFLVIIGVLVAAGLFALQVLLTVVLALLIVVGPPLIALSAIPELSHLARAWAHALLAVMLVPLGWTVLFATAGALCLDATSFTGGAGGLSGHIAAAFAGLITFALAVKLPLMLLGETRRFFGAAGVGGSGSGGAQAQSTMPGSDRMRMAHARLRSATFDGVPSLGASVGAAAGAMGAPAGGPVGAARRGLAGAARRSGILPAAVAAGAVRGAIAGRATTVAGGGGRERGGLRQRLTRAGALLANAPNEARVAMVARSGRAARGASRSVPATATARGARRSGASSSAGQASVVAGQTRSARAATPPHAESPRTSPAPSSPPAPRAQARPQAPSDSVAGGQAQTERAAPDARESVHPGRRIATDSRREAAAPARPENAPGKPAAARQPPPREQRTKQAKQPPATSRAQRPARGTQSQRKPRPRPKP